MPAIVAPNRREFLIVGSAGLIDCLRPARAAASSVDDGWTRFRGPNGAGHPTGGRGYPTKLNNVLWKRPVVSGKSSPIATSRHIFLTGERDHKLVTACLERSSGRLLWEREVERARTEPRHSMNTGSASTPCTDGSRVFAFFADFGLIAFDTNGKELWRQPLGPFSAAWGMASSPIVEDGLVVLQVDGMDESFITALDPRTGRRRWLTKRPSLPHSYSSPMLWRNPQGAVELIAFAPTEITSYHLQTGQQRWSAPIAPGTTVASPILAQDHLITICYARGQEIPSFRTALQKWDKNADGKISPDEFPSIGPDAPAAIQGERDVLSLISARIGNRDGTVTEEKWREGYQQVAGRQEIAATRLSARADGTVVHSTAWRYTRNVPHVPSPVYAQGLVYVLGPGGVLTTLRPETGEPVKVGRLDGALGNYMASPVSADDKLYCLSMDGVLSVLRLGQDWQVLTTRDLGEPSYATPALVGGNVFVRTETSLLCFGADS